MIPCISMYVSAVHSKAKLSWMRYKVTMCVQSYNYACTLKSSLFLIREGGEQKKANTVLWLLTWVYSNCNTVNMLIFPSSNSIPQKI